MKTTVFVLLAIMYFMSIMGCAPAYVPNVINTPLLSKKGELQATIYTGTAGIDPQLAYALTDNIGVMLNGSFMNRSSEDSNDYHKHNFVEMGAGYFTKISDSGRFGAYGGFGGGSLKAELDNNVWVSDANVKGYRFFVQPSIGAVSDVFDGSFSTRIVAVGLHQNDKKEFGYFLEPALSAAVGYKYVKAFFQLGFSLPLGSENLRFTYQPLIFSVGIRGNINVRE